MKHLYYLTFSLLFILTSTSYSQKTWTVAAGNEAQATKAETYKKWHDVCLKGKVEDIDKQIEKFENQISNDGKDSLAKVYLGSAQALRAKYSYWGLTKLNYLRSAEKTLDAAVKQSPNDARVRMVRAIAGYKVPVKFKRRPTALKDFEFLVPIVKNPRGRLKNNERQVILYYGYLAYKEDGRNSADELKNLCHKIAPNSKYGRLTN